MSLRFVRQLRNNTAQSLVLIVKFGAQRLAALRLGVPSSNKHIPFISYSPFSAFEKLRYLDEEQGKAPCTATLIY